MHYIIFNNFGFFLEEMNDTNDDEANDPEFDFMNEFEKETQDKKTEIFEEMRFDRATSISSKYFFFKFRKRDIIDSVHKVKRSWNHDCWHR